MSKKIKPKKEVATFNEAIARSKAGLKDGTNNLVKFSFKYLIQDHSKFDYQDHPADYFLMLLDRLKALCCQTIDQFRNDHSKGLRAHPIDWNETTETSFGIPGEDQLVDQPYQFTLTANEYGRVHGFLIQNRFYIVWLDKDHKLYT